MKQLTLLLFTTLSLNLLTAQEKPAEAPKQPAKAGKQPVDWVKPEIDTKKPRFFYFSSASRPFGMVNLSPDTKTDSTWDSGYRYYDDED